jgi:hypothetical protein
MLPIKIALPIILAAIADKYGYGPRDLKKIKPAIEREFRQVGADVDRFKRKTKAKFEPLKSDIGKSAKDPTPQTMPSDEEMREMIKFMRGTQ